MQMYFDVFTVLMFGLLGIAIITFLRLKKKKSYTFLLLFTMFYIYLFKVLDYTLFQFQSLLILKYFIPGLLLNGETVEKSLNLIPLITLTPQDLQTSLLNILLFVPFGIGLPFISSLYMKKTVLIGALVSIVIEILQFVTGFIGNITFRIADINDVLFNTVGVVIGYVLFIGFVHTYHNTAHNRKRSTNPISQYILGRPQIKRGVKTNQK